MSKWSLSVCRRTCDDLTDAQTYAAVRSAIDNGLPWAPDNIFTPHLDEHGNYACLSTIEYRLAFFTRPYISVGHISQVARDGLYSDSIHSAISVTNVARGFLTSLAAGVLPFKYVQSIFAVDARCGASLRLPRTGPTNGAFSKVAAVFSARYVCSHKLVSRVWKDLYHSELANNTLSYENLVEALVRGDLPERFEEWINELGPRTPALRKILLPGVLDQVPWHVPSLWAMNLRDHFERHGVNPNTQRAPKHQTKKRKRILEECVWMKENVHLNGPLTVRSYGDRDREEEKERVAFLKTVRCRELRRALGMSTSWRRNLDACSYCGTEGRENASEGRVLRDIGWQTFCGVSCMKAAKRRMWQDTRKVWTEILSIGFVLMAVVGLIGSSIHVSRGFS